METTFSSETLDGIHGVIFHNISFLIYNELGRISKRMFVACSGYYFGIGLEGRRKTTVSSVRITGASAEIRIEHL
jgi:hypothetical protein